MDTEFKWKTDKWKDIEDLVQRWARRNPEEFRYNLAYIRALREDMKDPKYGELASVTEDGKIVRNGGLRHGLSIPPGLMNYIQTFYPEFMKHKRDLREFGRRFPIFRIAERL